MSAHLDQGFGPLDLEALADADRGAARAHLDACESCAADFRAAAEALASVGLAEPPLQPPPELRARLLATVSTSNRFVRFAEQVARLVDIGVDQARALLAKIDDAAAWTKTPLPGIFNIDIDGGPAVANAVTGFVRIEPGQIFPEHDHLGDEAALVLQGACIEDSGRIAKRGDLVEMKPGMKHALRALPGPDFIYLAVVKEGITIGGQRIGKGDPRA